MMMLIELSITLSVFRYSFLRFQLIIRSLFGIVLLSLTQHERHG